ncbi:MAG: hypothetical protein US83_C0003G0091 [Candidatus Falkowbacteria bacterium GW2011_GWC2_38_22]|uniref:Transcobalamin-like C-terminal domain-containing protein n=1 Tax=Candidatus Falkowbacteria bacterium GW2011_GWE1_38_31 TaxID=1618638 RepID=A0A0G0N2B7_9BACT|nr:MAG: hypothetical protein US73_C0001G0183 [Candidatus Falkowbacteria bacterium GW2011_GWF2_38_1205]KKQ61842.1 MAG: hypothetical protein US83_C0003G0091 [Candidatus Falkowbacteria bacterium GW2011_GWC2_38_22]KKQ64150.1 MAG: hypothetical protein US84_C0002G0182 [Candidatus Falkowbacteria bacterium GW2011_GWF1_38_22]KKQ66500.1 MAG: hypothetical protein US87_C0001G0021 [Candidatus Falkowbacteria bacterium GW2011_GWE2_38_254]KKQ71256.1 MAG: hypothetical protein US91_C0001G0183 [Candidatus Falkowb
MKNLLIIPFILASLIFGFYSGVLYSDKQAKKTAESSIQNEKNAVNLMFDFGDGKVKTFNDIAINNDVTVFSVIQKVSDENNLKLSTKDFGNGMGAFIEGIDGYMNDYNGDKYWQFWVNGEYAKIGAGSYVLKGGEVVEWKYVKGRVN